MTPSRAIRACCCFILFLVQLAGCSQRATETGSDVKTQASPKATRFLDTSTPAPTPSATPTVTMTATPEEIWPRLDPNESLAPGGKFQWFHFLQKSEKETLVIASDSHLWKAQLSAHGKKISPVAQELGLSDFRKIAQMPQSVNLGYVNYLQDIRDMALSPDGKYVAVVSNDYLPNIFYLIDPARGEVVFAKIPDEYVNYKYLAWTSQGDLLIAASQWDSGKNEAPSSLILFSPDTHETETVKEFPFCEIFGPLTKSPQADLFVSYQCELGMYLFDLESREIVWNDPTLRGECNWSPDGQFLICLTYNENYLPDGILLLDKTGKRLKSEKVNGKLIEAIWSPDGKEIILITSYFDRTDMYRFNADLSEQLDYTVIDESNNMVGDVELAPSPGELYMVWSGDNPGISLYNYEQQQEINRVP